MSEIKSYLVKIIILIFIISIIYEFNLVNISISNKIISFDSLRSFSDELKKPSLSENSINQVLETTTRISTSTTITTSTAITYKDSVINVKIFNLSSSLEPKEEYEQIQCRKSAFFHVSTTLCVHRVDLDVHVSGSIMRDGVWERHIIMPFTDYIHNNPDWLVLDVGANIGQYSLYAAKMEREVLAVEPFHDNILRIHKASQLENTTKKITLVKNGLSNKRNEVKRLQPNNGNIGGQSLLNHKNEQYNKIDLEKDKYMVETILFDDLIDYLPKKQNGEEYSKAILKIDIEGFEPYAFQNASKIFDRLDIRIIFMEWGNFPGQKEMHNLIEEMINFLRHRRYKAVENKRDLIFEQWKTWPWDIIWVKE
ncbi:unnamed protein product [Brachionus calyciflorus]|uniref:Methyltransferase FkbM domain-containing protein n=1 Tax=Brachionus calyciflorus TaxID=104777 RepID=A0A813WXC1_9BILA|nr:unnamed protein product [Brachionus calyciflorus]